MSHTWVIIDIGKS